MSSADTHADKKRRIDSEASKTSPCADVIASLEKRDFADAIALATASVAKDHANATRAQCAAALSVRLLDNADFNARTVSDALNLRIPSMRVLIIGGGRSNPLEIALARRIIDSGDALVLHVADSARPLSSDNGDHELLDNPFYQLSSVDLLREFQVDGPVHVVYLFPSVVSLEEIQSTDERFVQLSLRLPIVAEQVVKFARSKSSRLIFASSALIYGDPFDHHASLALDAIKADAQSGVPEEFRGYTSTTGTFSPLTEAVRSVEAWISVANRELKMDSLIARVGSFAGQNDLPEAGSYLHSFVRDIESSLSSGLTSASLKVPANELARKISLIDIAAVADGLFRLIEYPVVDDPKKTMELNFERFRVFNLSNTNVSTAEELLQATKSILVKHGKAIDLTVHADEPQLGFCDPAFTLTSSVRFARTFGAWSPLQTPAELFASILDSHLSKEASKTNGDTNGHHAATESKHTHTSISQDAEQANAQTLLLRSAEADLKFKFYIGPIPQPDGSHKFPGIGKLKINPAKKGVVFMTGGAGFLASNLIGKLLRENWQVIAVDNLAAGVKENLDQYLLDPRFWDDFQFIQFDVSNPYIVSSEVPVKIVYHGASLASPEFYYKDMVGTLRCGINGSIYALELAKQMNARFIFTSTSEVYGDPFNHPQQKAYLGNVNTTGKRCQYDQSKRFGETLADAYFQKGLDVRILRIFNTYGPLMRPDDGRVVTNFIHQALVGVPMTIYGSGRQTRSFLFVNDQIDGQYRLLTFDGPFKGSKLIDRTFNVGNDEYEIDMCVFADIVKKVVTRITGRKVRVAHVNWTQIRDRGLNKEQAEAKAEEYNKELSAKAAKASGGAHHDDGDRDVQYIAVPEFEGSESYLVVRDEYDKFDPQRRRADASDAHDPSLLDWKGSVTPLTHGVERLVQFFLATPRTLRGIDRVLKIYDYDRILSSDGLCIRPEYITERYLETAGFLRCESEVAVFDESEARFLADHFARHRLAEKPVGTDNGPQTQTWHDIRKAIESNLLLTETIRKILLSPL
eukprot:TRINITY_DN2955_c0_g1_i1.p1 TRINITY_DN2955_c0_g1~~TRINITY_DN2955_c0_g1_i1.p1  ORF type:complete len:1031 (+),score=229.33 TRINITY_DN2955_c0_g1_i1:51-3143(+)